MELVVVANEQMKDELLSGGVSNECKINWISSSTDLSSYTNADAVIDLLFEQNNYDITPLKTILSKPVFVNSVNKTIQEIGVPFFRINGWPGFIKRSIAEVSSGKQANRAQAENILTSLNKKPEWVPDIKGFLSSRVVSMIINEAYFALEESISTKEEIDIAMKLGTNYPYGPFEWGKKIGLKNIRNLLYELTLEERRYQPAPLLIKEASESQWH